jgi:hypothetical protein
MQISKYLLGMFAIAAGVIDTFEGFVKTHYPVQCGFEKDVRW